MVATVDNQAECAKLRHCLACGGGLLITYLDLKRQPLANDYHDGTVELGRFPLALNVCEHCYHSQLSHAVSPELLFSNYSYVSGTSQTLNRYFSDFVDRVCWEHPSDKLTILDIAGNDGTLLSKFVDRGHTVLNIDPAINLWEVAEGNGVPTLSAFWNSELAQSMDIKHDVIVAMNVLGHVSDPYDFLVGCRDALAEGGSVYIQTSQCEMVEHGEFDTCYHEHISYFTTRSFLRLAKRVGLVVQDVDKVPVHGTSYLWHLKADGLSDDSVWDLYQYETTHGYYTDTTYRAFADKAAQTADFLTQVTDIYRAEGFAIVGYGAAAKGNTVLNYIGQPVLDWIVDENPLKVGFKTPGTDIPIRSLDHLKWLDRPLCLVVLAWNFYPEIVQRVKDMRGRDDDVFIKYFPAPTVSRSAE